MPATSAVLTGLSLATGIAREATDSVPIVKQVLGVASRIVGLAEQIEKNREDFHALAERAKSMDGTIAAVAGDRELGHVMLRRLEAMNAVLRDIEKQFATHIKRGRVRRSLGYIFTVRKEVERLKGDFDDRLRELEVAANIDTNVIARGESRYIGEFRNIRHYEINLLRHLPNLTRSCAGYTVNYHSAMCEGSNEVFVVQYTVEYDRNDDARRAIEAHESILERMSLIQNRHPTIACLYGKNQGPRESRFVVLKIGDVRPLADVLAERSADVALFGRIAAKLMDACCHLPKHGAEWNCHVPVSELLIDHNYEPIIGVHNDISSISGLDSPPAGLVAWFLGKLFELSCAPAQIQEKPRDELRSTMWTRNLVGSMIDRGHLTRCKENIIRPAEISSLIPFSQESWMYLQRADDGIFSCAPRWGTMLVGLASGTKKREGHILHAIYSTSVYEEQDLLRVYCVDDHVDAVYHTETHFEIPHSAATEVMQRLGIKLDDSGNQIKDEEFNLQRFEGPGAMSPMCTGWTRGFGRWAPWWCAIRRYRPECHRKQYDWDSPAGVQLADIQSGRDAE